LESYSYRNVLERGFAVVRDGAGNLVGRSRDLVTGQSYDLEMGDGITRVTAGAGMTSSEPAQHKDDSANIASENTATSAPEISARPKAAKKKNPRPQEDDRQGSLL
jgi:exodeoxyribonuclease VII large subunit